MELGTLRNDVPEVPPLYISLGVYLYGKGIENCGVFDL
jgi:hypothetical protein